MLTNLAAELRQCLAADHAPQGRDELYSRTAAIDPPQRRGAVLVLLFLVALLPRAGMAWKLDTLSSDGVLYLRLAEALEHGESIPPEDRPILRYGAYPLLMAGLHRLGFEWETTAEWWGVLMASLAVLPLFGWLRRQFDDRVALVAGLLYAAHPKLIEWSPEAMRDPTFWFVSALSLYLLWRAIADVDWRWFLAAGLAIGLSCMTRFEGFFLLLPLVGWTLLRAYWLQTGRARLVAGSLLCAGTLPLVMLLIGRMLPRESTADPLHSEQLDRARQWVTATVGGSEPLAAPIAPPVEAAPTVTALAVAAPARVETTAAAVEPPPPAPLPPSSAPPPAAPSVSTGPVASAASADADHVPEAPPKFTFWRKGWAFLHTMERGLTPLFGLLVVLGYALNFRVLNRPDKLPVMLMVAAIGGGTWIHLSLTHQASSRYVLNIALVTASAAALGLSGCAQWLAAQAARRWPRRATGWATTAALLALAGIVGWGDALSSDMRSRRALANFGRWVEDQYGAGRVVVGSESQLPLIAYYAHGRGYLFPPGMHGQGLVDWVRQTDADVVVISTRKQSSQDYQAVLEQLPRLRLEVVAQQRIPAAVKNTIILGRPTHNSPDALQAHRPRP